MEHCLGRDELYSESRVRRIDELDEAAHELPLFVS
jgi:hypothetical protein